MSTTTLHCPTCKLPIADKRPAGPIKVRPGVVVVLVVEGAKLTCQCGAVRVVTLPSGA